MPETEPTAELNEGFSEPGATARLWTEVAEVLSETEMFWLYAPIYVKAFSSVIWNLTSVGFAEGRTRQGWAAPGGRAGSY
jgi:hypothetical protein